MPNSKTYLNVPYAEKDAAKTLGARWDPAMKKWYVPAGKDIASFAQWQVAMDIEAPLSKPTRVSSPINNNGAFTQPSIENFVAYSGNQPPWD